MPHDKTCEQLRLLTISDIIVYLDESLWHTMTIGQLTGRRSRLETLAHTESGAEIVALTRLEEIEQLIQVFERIAREEGWNPGDQLRAFMQSTVYLAAQVRGEIAGGVQLTRISASGVLPCHAVWPEIARPAPRDSAHVVVLALRKDVRATDDLFWQLCLHLWRYCWLQHLTTLFLEVTPQTLRIYRRLGWPLLVIGPLRSHWGEECYPCTMAIDEAALSFMARSNGSTAYRKLLHGGVALRFDTGKRTDHDGHSCESDAAPCAVADAIDSQPGT